MTGYTGPKAGMSRRGGLDGPGLVDLAVDTSQEEFGQAGGGHLANSVRLSINHILKGLSRRENHKFKRFPHPDRVFLLEIVVEFLKESPCLTIRTDLNKLDSELKICR